MNKPSPMETDVRLRRRLAKTDTLSRLDQGFNGVSLQLVISNRCEGARWEGNVNCGEIAGRLLRGHKQISHVVGSEHSSLPGSHSPLAFKLHLRRLAQV